MLKTALIAHGRLRDNKLVQDVAAYIGVEPTYTDRKGHAIDLAFDVDADVDLIIAAGGDGTVSEVANGIMMRGVANRPAMLVVPLGTGNDVARTTHTSSEYADILRSLDQMTIRNWDVLQIEYTDTKGVRRTRYSINVASIGLGGHVTQIFNDTLRKLPGHVGYFFAIIKAMLTTKPVRVSIETDTGEVHRFNSLSLCLCNAPWFGGGIGIAPGAIVDDGVFDITVVGDVSALTYLRFLPALKAARDIPDKRITKLRATACNVETASPMPLEVEGEFIGYSPLSVKLLPLSLRIVVA